MLVDLAQVRQALDNEELVPCFQPVVQIHTGRLVGVEVLARWRHPSLGLVLPENFISLAEYHGLAGLLMQQILRKALKSSSWLREPTVMAVNVSPTQLLDLSLPSQIMEAARLAEFPLERLTIEITESALMGNLECAQRIACDLKAMGCRLALDDFGTGYSSLIHLQALPFDELKIDRSFVNAMTKTRESRKIVAAIIGLGHSLGLITVAEGIETEQQAEMLLGLGCEWGQGWLYGKPVTADQISQMVSSAPHVGTVKPSAPEGSWVVSSLEAHPAQRLAQMEAIYDGAPVGLCFLDRSLRYVSLNQRLADRDGVAVETHLGKTVKEMIPELYGSIEPHLERALRGEAVRDVEISWPPSGPGGPVRTDLASCQPAFDESGEVIGISIAVSDVTHLKQVEAALREKEAHLRQMVEANPEIAWVMDANGNNIDVSSKWVQLTGLSKEQTQNLGWMEAVHPDDVMQTINTVREALIKGIPIDTQFRVKSVDWGWKWMRTRGLPHRTPTGEILLYGSVVKMDSREYQSEPVAKLPSERGAQMNVLDRVGIYLESAEERNTICAAAIACGVEPTLLERRQYEDAVGLSAGTQIDANPPKTDGFQWIVTDDNIARIDPRLLSGGKLFTSDHLPLFTLIRDRNKGEDADESVEDIAFPWTMHRPLIVDRVREQLLLAVRMARFFCERHDAVLEELNRARSIFDSVCVGITICDVSLPGLPLIYANAEFLRMTGYTEQEVYGRNCKFLQGDETNQPGVTLIRKAIVDRNDARALLRNYQKDGTPFWNELYLSPIFDLSGGLTHFVGIQNDVTEQVETAMRLEFLANHDGLTGLANRALLMEQLNQAMLRTKRGNGSIAVLFFDLDNFKHVNDIFGHDAGDGLLKIMAERLRAETRAGETAARFGGDEFVVVLEDLYGDRDLIKVKERLMVTMSQSLTIAGQLFRPSTSVGMAMFPGDGDTAEALIKAADFRMYSVKHQVRRTGQLSGI